MCVFAVAALIYHQHFIQGPEISKMQHKIETTDKVEKKLQKRERNGKKGVQELLILSKCNVYFIIFLYIYFHFISVL